MRKHIDRIRKLMPPLLLAVFTWNLSVHHNSPADEQAAFVAEPENTGVINETRFQQGSPMGLPVVSLQVAAGAPFEAAAFRAGLQPGWMNVP